MAILALPLAIAVATSLSPSRQLWRPGPGTGLQPTQVQVEARLVLEGERLAVYQQEGYEPRLDPAQLAATVRELETRSLARLEAVFGPAPDHDGNGKVLVLVCDTGAPAASVSPFDLLTEEQARLYGMHSNQGEVIYHPFAYTGNRASANRSSLAEAYFRLLDVSGSTAAPGWSRLLAAHVPFLLGQTTPRWLWGDADPLGRTFSPHDPWSERGWPLLLVEYLRERLGDAALRELQQRALCGLPPVEVVGGSAADPGLLADFAMACWLDDPALADGRFGFAAVDPPRPLAAARAQASTPSSGLLQVGAGGMVFLVVSGSGERSLPLSLQGDPDARWAARAVRVRERGPDEELAVAFDEDGVARLEMPRLPADESVVVAVVALPADAPGADRRILPLQWGVGWVPHFAADDSRQRLSEAVQKALPDGGKAARARLATTLGRLVGEVGASTPHLTTRYAYAPDAGQVVEVLRQETERRGLRASIAPFGHRSPAGVEQEWQNVLIEIPGNDPRRWPVVVAAHWDAVRADAEDSFARALSATDNAAAVATVLEVAAALSRRPRQNPVLVALLAGGCHDAAGAAALLAQRQGRFAGWIDLEGVGIPERSTRSLHIRVEAPKAPGRLPGTLIRACKDVGLIAREQPELASPHTGAMLAARRGIPAAVIRGRTPEDSAFESALPPSVEQRRVSLDLLTLVAKAVADATTVVAGGH